MQQATYDAVDEVGRATAEAGIDGGFHKGGELLVARGPHGVPSLEGALEEYERFGFGDRYRLLDAAETADTVRIAGAVRGLYTDSAAVIHPGRLVRGLARHVEGPGRRSSTRARPSPGSDRATHPAGRPSSRPPARSVPRRSCSRARPTSPSSRRSTASSSRCLADRPHGARHGRAVGRDRLAQPRDRGLDPAVDRLPQPHRGRADPVRRARRALPVRQPDPPRVRPPRPDPRATPRLRPRVVPDAARHPVHARLGRAAGDAPRLAPDDGVRRGDGHRHGARLHRARRGGDEPRGTGPDGPPDRIPHAAHRAAGRRPPVAELGDRAVPLARRPVRAGAVGRIDAKAERTGRPPTGRSLAERLAAH